MEQLSHHACYFDAPKILNNHLIDSLKNIKLPPKIPLSKSVTTADN